MEACVWSSARISVDHASRPHILPLCVASRRTRLANKRSQRFFWRRNHFAASANAYSTHWLLAVGARSRTALRALATSLAVCHYTRSLCSQQPFFSTHSQASGVLYPRTIEYGPHQVGELWRAYLQSGPVQSTHHLLIGPASSPSRHLFPSTTSHSSSFRAGCVAVCASGGVEPVFDSGSSEWHIR